MASTSIDSATANLPISSEGTTTLTFRATDKDGNVESPKTLVVHVDKTAPTNVAGLAARAADSAPWYRSAVAVSFGATDAISGMGPCTTASYDGPDAEAVSVTGMCADLAGNEATALFHFSFDATPPAITASRDPAPNGFGWNNGDVKVSFACSDATSGIDSCGPGPQVVTTEGLAQAVIGRAVDKAGNRAAVTERINIDRTAPTITPSRLPLANALGWNNSEVIVSFACADDLSGIDRCEPDHVIGAEGDSQSVTGEAVDKAGNRASTSLGPIRIDKTAPVVNCAAADLAWHAADVALGCTAVDLLSGLRVSADRSFSLVTSVPAGIETSNAPTGSHLVADVAGNTAIAGPTGGNRIDKKPPAIAILAPISTTYTINQVVAANYACSDGGSGVAACDGTVASGSAISTAAVGARGFSVAARDQVGNATSQALSYTVAYGVCLLYDPTKGKNSGSVFPIKVAVCDANGRDLSNAGLAVTAMGVERISDGAPAILDASGDANPDGNFRFDPTLGGTGGYIFNLSTAGFSSGTYAVRFLIAGDPTVHEVALAVK